MLPELLNFFTLNGLKILTAFISGGFGAWAVYVMFERKYAMTGKWPKHFKEEYYKKNRVCVIFISSIVATVYASQGWTSGIWLSVHVGASAPAIFGKLSDPAPIKE